DISQGRAAHLAPGSDPGSSNIYLKDSPRFKIRGQVLPLIPDTKIVFAPKGSDLTDANYFAQPNANGTFEIRAVSPGAYLLLATAGGAAWTSDVIAFNVTDRDIDGASLALAPTISISGMLTMEGSPRANLSEFHIKLDRSTTEFEQKIDALVGPDGA